MELGADFLLSDLSSLPQMKAFDLFYHKELSPNFLKNRLVRRLKHFGFCSFNAHLQSAVGDAILEQQRWKEAVVVSTTRVSARGIGQLLQQ